MSSLRTGNPTQDRAPGTRVGGVVGVWGDRKAAKARSHMNKANKAQIAKDCGGKLRSQKIAG
jgi:hypothetical protein